MGKEKLYTGIYTCEQCNEEYHCSLVPEKELTCTDCGARLIRLPKMDYIVFRWPPPHILKRTKPEVPG